MKPQEDGARKRRRLSEVSLQQEAPVRAQAVESGGNGVGPKKMLLAPPKPSVCRCLHQCSLKAILFAILTLPTQDAQQYSSPTLS